MGNNRFVVGFIQRAIRGPHYDCEISMRVLEGDKEALRCAMLERRQRVQDSKSLGRHDASRLSVDETNGNSQAGNASGLPPLRFGTINDPIPNGPDASPIDGSKASGWTTINAPVCTIYAGQMPYLSPDLLQFPIADSDGSIVVSILPVVSTGVLLGVRGQLHLEVCKFG
jgi:sphingosine kinase